MSTTAFAPRAASKPDAPAAPSLDASETRSITLGHALLAAVGLFASTAFVVWGSLIASTDPPRALAMLRTHGVAALFCALPAVAGASPSLLPSLRRGRALARLGLALHALALVLVVPAAHFGATLYGTRLPMAFSALHAPSSVPWMLGVIVASALSTACAALATLVALHSAGVDRSSPSDAAALPWALYVASWVQVLVAPITVLWVLFAAVERGTGLGLFDPSLGGDPLRFQLLRALWTQPTLVAALLVALGVIDDGLSDGQRSPGAARWILRWPYVALAALSPFGMSPDELTWHASAITTAQSSAFAMLFYVPFASVARRWLSLLRERPATPGATVSRACAWGALGALAIAAPAGVLCALPNVGPALSITPFASGVRHALMSVVVLATIGRAARSAPAFDRHPAALAAALAVMLGGALAFVSSMLVGLRGGVDASPAATVGAGLLASGLVTLAVLRIREALSDRDAQ